MDFLDLPGDKAVELTDEDLGEWLITAWLAFEAERAGIAKNAMSRAWIINLVEETAKIDSESVALAPLESALRKACKGDMAAAGRMYRDHL